MEALFLAIVAELISNAAFRGLIEDIALKIVSEVLHRRSVDPAFLAASDAAFAALVSAKTEEERTRAQTDLRALMARP